MDSVRITGRPEVPGQVIAPWGYGDHFVESKVPPGILAMSRTIRESSELGVTSSHLRDITINFRDRSMFRLDPHLDPPDDGGHVFIISFHSSVVLTFTPDQSNQSYLATRRTTRGPAPLRVRTEEQAIALRSWTDDDIDVLQQPGDLVHFFGDARYVWKHAIRAGIEVGPPYNGICDWWGDLSHVVKRGPIRISLVLAFS